MADPIFIKQLEHIHNFPVRCLGGQDIVYKCQTVFVFKVGPIFNIGIVIIKVMEEQLRSDAQFFKEFSDSLHNFSSTLFGIVLPFDEKRANKSFIFVLLYLSCTKFIVFQLLLYMIKQAIVFAFIALFIGLSQTAGVGGGPIVNISLMISMDYDAKLSISITYIFLIGGSIASVWKNSSKKNPKTNRPYLDLDLILLTLPVMSSGSLFGIVLKHFASEMLITIGFILLFVFLIFDLRKALIKMREINDANLITIKNVNNNKQMLSNLIDYAVDHSKQDQQFKQKSILAIKMCVGYYFLTLVVSLARGGMNFDSVLGINSCGFAGWLILFAHLAVSIYMSQRTATQIFAQAKQQPKKGITKQNVTYFLVAGFVAGLLGATLAIGGALILIPVWLKFGIDKDVAAGSTAPLILTAAMVAFTMAALNQYYEDISFMLIVFYLLLSFAGSAIVKEVITYLTNKYKLKSMVILLLLLVVVSSLVVMVPYQLSKFFDEPQGFMQFGQFC